MRVAILLVACSTVAHADAPREVDDVPVPPGEHGQTGAQVPPVPDFAVPPIYADGSHPVKELRVHAGKLVDTDVVRGVVTWVYDCGAANRKVGETDRDLKKRIDDDPTICERPKFFLGDAADTPPEKSLWIVDVPRPYTRMELARIAKRDRTAPDRCELAERCPPYRVGDKVVVSGAFATASPHAERNSDGLLVYARMTNVTQRWTSPGGSVGSWEALHEVAHAPATPIGAVPPPPPPSTAMRAHVDPGVVRASMDLTTKGNRELATKQLDDAAADYQKATATWAKNHLAWYGLGGARAQQGRWDEARTAFLAALDVRGDVAMYRMWAGIAGYERAVATAREDQARREGRRVDEVQLDLRVVNFVPAREHLQQAIAADPGLWRAHYYLGRIARDEDKLHDAAVSFSRAITANAREAAPYIALAELYRRWDYVDQALAVATVGTANLVATSAASDVWFELGMAFEAKQKEREAIDAFSKAVDARPANLAAKFQRGQAYFRRRDHANAKRDLTEFVKAAGPAMEFEKQQAAKMLMDLAASP